jgi:hypothetical protein
MPATPFYDKDPFDPKFQRIKDDTERQIYGETGGISTDEQVGTLFRKRFDEIRNCVLGHDVLRTDHWKLKGTMQQLADRLGTDHGTISRWLHRGILPQSVENFLMACPTRPDDWQAPIDRASNSRHRGGFLAVANYLYGRLPGHSTSDGDVLREIHCEILFSISDHQDAWEHACANADYDAALKIVRSVSDDPDREILPVWYIKTEIKQVSGFIDRLRSNKRLAFKYLSRLQRHWEGVFVLTQAGTEGMGWMNPWADGEDRQD